MRGADGGSPSAAVRPDVEDLLTGQTENERGALVGGRSDGDAAAVRFGDLAHDEEPQPQAGARLPPSLERLKNHGQQIGRDGAAAVVNRDRHLARFAARAQLDVAGAMSNGVPQQVRDGLMKPVAIPLPSERPLALDVDGPSGKRPPQIIDHFAAQIADVHRLGNDRNRSLTGTGVIGEAANHLAHSGDGPLDALHVRPRVGADHGPPEQRGRNADGVERILQIVREHGDVAILRGERLGPARQLVTLFPQGRQRGHLPA